MPKAHSPGFLRWTFRSPLLSHDAPHRAYDFHEFLSTSDVKVPLATAVFRKLEETNPLKSVLPKHGRFALPRTSFFSFACVPRVDAIPNVFVLGRDHLLPLSLTHVIASPAIPGELSSDSTPHARQKPPAFTRAYDLPETAGIASAGGSQSFLSVA